MQWKGWTRPLSKCVFIILGVLLDFLAQLRLSDLLQGVLGGRGCLGDVVPESIFHHVQAGLGRLLPQDVGIATCG